MKKIFCLLLCATLALGLLAGCGKTGGDNAEPKDYAKILADARQPDFNDAFPIITDPEQDNFGLMEAYGFATEDMASYAISISPMNVNAYGVIIILPVSGHEAAVDSALTGFIESQTAAQEHYLPDQYEIAKGTLLETMPGGERVLVMSEDASTVMDGIKKALS